MAPINIESASQIRGMPQAKPLRLAGTDHSAHVFAVSSGPSDRELGIKAQRTVGKDRLGLQGPNVAHAERYEPSPPGVLTDMLLTVDFDPPKTTFVDLGCGKGRVLCHAALRPFAKVVGVELSETLCNEARENLQRLKQQTRRAKEVEVLHRDAARYRFDQGPLLVYLYNPFRGPVLRAVLSNLLARQQRDPAPIHILYYEPRHRAVFENRAEVEFVDDAPKWAIYRLATPGE